MFYKQCLIHPGWPQAWLPVLDNLELLILPPSCWDYGWAPLCPVHVMLRIEPAKGFMHIRQALSTERYHWPSVAMLLSKMAGRSHRGCWSLEVRWKHPRAEECLLIAKRHHFVAQASLELTVFFRLAPKLVTPILLSAGIMGMDHHIWIQIFSCLNFDQFKFR